MAGLPSASTTNRGLRAALANRTVLVGLPSASTISSSVGARSAKMQRSRLQLNPIHLRT